MTIFGIPVHTGGHIEPTCPPLPFAARLQPLSLLALSLGLGGVAAAASYLAIGNHLVGVDDANIYMAYGRNLAGGEGFVYYPGGEYVEGFTSMGWTLLMAAAYRLVPSSPEGVLFALSILLVAATWCVVAGFLTTAATARTREHRLIPVLFVGAWCLSSPAYTVWMTTSFMETGLWSLTLSAGAVLFAHLSVSDRRVDGWTAAAVSGTAVLVRPEALAIVPLWIGTAFVAATMVQRRIRGPMAAVAPAVAVFTAAVIALTAFRLAYFGYPLPNTYYAKVSPSASYNLIEGARYLRAFVSSFPLTLAVFAGCAFLVAAFGAESIAGRRRPGSGSAHLTTLAPWAALSSTVLATCALPLLTGGDHFAGFRILQPLWPLFALVLLYFVTKLPARLWVPTAVTLIATAFATGSPRWFGELATLRHEYEIADRGRRLGRALNDLAPEGERPSVGVIAAGGVATTYRGPIIDLMGLNNVKMGHSPGPRFGPKNHAAFEAGVFWELQPDILIPRVMHSDDDLQNTARWMAEKDAIYLRGLFGTPRFRERYRLIVVRLPGTGRYPSLAAYGRTDWIERHPGVLQWTDDLTALGRTE